MAPAARIRLAMEQAWPMQMVLTGLLMYCGGVEAGRRGQLSVACMGGSSLSSIAADRDKYSTNEVMQEGRRYVCGHRGGGIRLGIVETYLHCVVDGHSGRHDSSWGVHIQAHLQGDSGALRHWDVVRLLR